jgi:hypothetical protein
VSDFSEKLVLGRFGAHTARVFELVSTFYGSKYQKKCGRKLKNRNNFGEKVKRPKCLQSSYICVSHWCFRQVLWEAHAGTVLELL